MSLFIFIKTDENELQDVALLFWYYSLHVEISEALRSTNRLQHGHIMLCHHHLDKSEPFSSCTAGCLKRMATATNKSRQKALSHKKVLEEFALYFQKRLPHIPSKQMPTQLFSKIFANICKIIHHVPHFMAK